MDRERTDRSPETLPFRGEGLQLRWVRTVQEHLGKRNTSVPGPSQTILTCCWTDRIATHGSPMLRSDHVLSDLVSSRFKGLLRSSATGNPSSHFCTGGRHELKAQKSVGACLRLDS
jgi:hypothetical protein